MRYNLKGTAAAAVTYACWAVSIASVLGSLYFSEILHYAPCTLCWWQRVFMYPLALIIPVGIVLRDRRLPYYVLPLALPGLGVAAYQNLLTWGVIPEKLAPCSLGVSCATKYIEWLGFVSIPFLSLLAFAAVTAGMVILIKLNKTYEQ